MPTRIDLTDLAQRVAGMTRQDAGWFSPMKPLAPLAPAGNEGRAWDFPVGYNARTQPRHGEGVGFSDMRALADSYDLVRLLIETRKDQMCKLEWKITPVDDKARADAGAEAIQAFLQSPDREYGWDEWLRMLLEDLLVIDAPTIYPRRTRGGQPYALELVDGATIKRVIDGAGRTPLPPDPAYQQIIKGVPASNYTRDELYYRPRNPRIHRAYGYSPVEQIIVTVNIALRRQQHQMSYYTEGNVPEALIGVPETWTPDQIKQFQLFWDALIEGDSAQKRHAKFVPGAIAKGYVPTREPVLKDVYDEWLARVCCFAFSISPTPFINQVNRATADTALETALEEGLAPLMRWVTGVMTRVIADFFGRPDLRFAFKNSKAVDPKEQADIHRSYIDAKVLTPDEVRSELGMEPLSPEERAAAWPAPPAPILPGDNGHGADESDDAEPDAKVKEALAKAGKPVPVIDRERAAVEKCIKALTGVIESRLDAWKTTVLAAIAERYVVEKSAQGGGVQEKARAIVDSIEIDWGELAPPTAAELAVIVQDGVEEALRQIDYDLAVDALALVNADAVAYANQRAAEMVGMKWIDGHLVQNPVARWRIDDSTRKGILDAVAQAMQDGWSNDRLAAHLSEHHLFSASRAMNIARTETAMADVNGNLIAYRASGVVSRKQWLLAQSDYCPICATNAAAGVIGLDDRFPDGTIAPPGHPGCRCDLLPVLVDSEKTDPNF